MLNKYVYPHVADWFKNRAFKLSGANFLIGSYPIARKNGLEACVILDTRCLPNWHRHKESQIIIDLSPFKPRSNMTIERVRAHDASRYGVKDIHNRTIDAESLDIAIAWRRTDIHGYVLETLHYLPDTKKTFVRSLGGYPKSESELDAQWEFRERLHYERTDSKLIDVLPYISKPNWFHYSKFHIASFLAYVANRVNQKSEC